MRETTRKEIHKELQDLDSIGSPHIEKILIGGNIDQDLLSLFHKELQDLVNSHNLVFSGVVILAKLKADK
jgi:hypothetical protein